MVKGWFIGHFKPTLFNTTAVEVAVKRYRKGDAEGAHYHMIATEFTVVIEGEIEMGGTTYRAGEIVVVPAGVPTGFLALTDAVTTVVKIPGAPNDKYPQSHQA